MHRVFKEYDDDDSGELSYEEARNFIKGIYTFFEKAGNLTEEEKRKLFGMIEEVKINDILLFYTDNFIAKWCKISKKD